MNYELLPEEARSVASLNLAERRVVLVADSEQGRQDLRDVAYAIGLRVLFDGGVADGGTRIREGFVGDCIFVDISGGDDGDKAHLLSSLSETARTQGLPVLLNAVPECLDEAAYWLDTPNSVLMSRAGPSDWIGAYALAQFNGVLSFREVATESNMRLQRLADEVDRIARTLSDLAGAAPASLGVSDAQFGYAQDPARVTQITVGEADVRSVIKLRRLRDRFFAADLFADPAWDMLLDLMAARLGRFRVAVSSLCIAAAVPPTTALRWIKTMTDSGIFVRVPDPDDGRRIFLELSEDAAAGMLRYMTAAKAEGGLAI